MLWMHDQIAFLAMEPLRCELLLDTESGTALLWWVLANFLCQWCSIR